MLALRRPADRRCGGGRGPLAAADQRRLTAAAPRPRWDPDRGLIPRGRLTDRLRGSAHCPILLLVAPAGYGKTTILAEWAAADPRPFAWVPLDERHDDPNFLGHSIAAALDEIAPIGASVFDVLETPRSGVSEALLPRLVEAISSQPNPVVLVLDDVHRLGSEASLKLITDLALQLGAESQLALASRREAGIPAARLRAEGRLAELRAPDLAMTRGELRSLLATRGLELEKDSVVALAERTEGWPVANYLATLILEEAADPDVAIARVTGEDRILADYLRDELLSALEPGDHEFLVRCAALEQLNGPVCDAALDRSGSAELLRELSRSNLLVMPLDRVDREYRFHALLRETLLAELDRGDPTVRASIHTRASAWYAERTDFDRAIAHAIASRDVAAAGLLLWGAAAEYASRGREATLRRFLGKFSDEQIAASAPLALARTTTCLARAQGTEIERWARAAVAALAAAPEDQRDALQISAELLRAAGASHGELAEIRRAVGPARKLLPEDSAWVSLACLIEGAALHLGGTGDPRATLDEGIQRGALQAPTVKTLCQAQRVLVALDDGDERLAWSLEEQASEAIERFGIGDLETEALVLAVSALIRARRGNLDGAMVAARRATALLAASPGISSWYEAETRIVLAQALLQLDDVSGAQAHLAEAEPYLRRIPDAPVLERMYEEASAGATAKAEGGERWPLTRAELRLLQMLPTHLSFKQIGEQLFVSTNTVKTQARSIYRKLDASSRTEAVAAAQAGGLIKAAPEPARPAATSSGERISSG